VDRDQPLQPRRVRALVDRMMQSGHCSAPNTTLPVGPLAALPLEPLLEFLLLEPHAASPIARATATTDVRTQTATPEPHEDLPLSTVMAELPLP